MPSALAHFRKFGLREGRRLRMPLTDAFRDAKARKLARIEPLLRMGDACVRTSRFFDCLTDELRQQFQIDDGGAESSNDYDGDALALFERHRDGLVLDVGAGRRSTYIDNVVNFEIAPFESTDVRGVAERLPFVDACFDAVVSIAVLEHVRDPVGAAAEIVRVLKPGGELMCCVAFLQPLHGYPHHYFNMTHTGLRSLFEPGVHVERVTTPDSTLPIFSLTWILQRWANGLTEPARREFLSLTVSDLLGPPASYLDRGWVRGLSAEKNLELASACVLYGRKRDER
ncbi:MAG: methyltransferase domain-containing protein [Acidobacteria bacterium]|nr:MAG: methyltransferase domain-containing protein [Acidobacteriota bacterium]